MSRINKTIKTNYTAQEMKSYASTHILPNKMLSSLLDSAIWDGDILHVKSKLGRGTIELMDNLVIFDIELSIAGSLAKNTLESSLEKEFKRLKS